MSSSYGQDSFIFARNNPLNNASESSIEVKWFTNGLYNEEGFNIYRKQLNVGTWEKLNENPVVKKFSIPSVELRADEDLSFFVDVVNNSPADLEEEFLFFNLLLKSFESTPLADFLGIYFQDLTAQLGNTYQYKIGIINGGQERMLSVSPEIECSLYQPSSSPTGIEVGQEKKNVTINWDQDEKRFYAVNIYANEDGEETRLNDQPIMLSQVPDSSGVLAYPRPMYKKNGFKKNVAYSFSLEGVDYFGQTTLRSTPITLIFNDTEPPPPASGLDGKADSLRVNLFWEQEYVEDLKGFNIFRSPKSEGPFQRVNDVMLDASATTYFEQIDIPGPYYYYVETIDRSNNTTESNRAFVDVQDVIPPLQPTGLTIRSDTGRMYLQWNANQETDLLGYLVYRTIDSDVADDYLLLNANPIQSTTYTQVLPKTVKNDFYYYLVAVDTSFNRSPQSTRAVAALPDVTPPETPFIKEIGYSEEGVVINWIQNVESDMLGYHVFRSDTSGGTAERVNVNIVSPTSFRFIDRSAETNQPYLYQMNASDIAGNISEKSAAAYAFWYEEELLEADLVLSIKSKKRKKLNRLDWNAIATDETKGYVVFGGKSDRVLKPLSKILATAVNFTNKTSEEKYYYQVRAYLQSGQVLYSNIVLFESN